MKITEEIKNNKRYNVLMKRAEKKGLVEKFHEEIEKIDIRSFETTDFISRNNKEEQIIYALTEAWGQAKMNE